MTVRDFLSLGVGGPSIPDYPIAIPIDAILPAQTNNAGKFLSSDGAHAYWGVALTGISIGMPIAAASLMAVLFVGTGSATLQEDPAHFVWDNTNNYLGVGTPTPAQALHVDGIFRLDTTALHAISIQFGSTATDTSSALIQYVDSQIVGSTGIVLTGVGQTNATVGVTSDQLLINLGSRLSFASGNIQASLGELTAVYACSGVPSNLIGVDGQFMLRSDGTAASALYYKVSGAWAIVGGGGGGGTVIGDPVSGGTPTYALFTDGSGNLAQSSSLTFTDSTHALQVGAEALSGSTVVSSVSVGNNGSSAAFTYNGWWLDIGLGVGCLSDAAVSGGGNFGAGYHVMTGTFNASTLNNVGIGYNALQSLAANASENTAMGTGSGASATSSIGLTLYGSQSGASAVTATNCTCVGTSSDVSAAGATNQNSFGFGAACTADNQFTMGDGSIVTLRCQQTSITALSDGRDKADVVELRYGLDFLLKLLPREFEWACRDGAIVGVKDVGFIAQEVQPFDDDRLRLVHSADPDRLELTMGRILPILVKGFHEVHARLAALEVQPQPA